VETTKKTSTTKAALLVLAALSMLLSGLFIATASSSDAQGANTCPAGFTLLVDGVTCSAGAVTVTTTSANSCAEGVVNAAGTQCVVDAALTAGAAGIVCPPNTTVITGGCARVVPATTTAATLCPGAGTNPNNCYTLVAGIGATAPACAAPSTPFAAVLVGTNDCQTPSATVPIQGQVCANAVAVGTVGGTLFSDLAVPTLAAPATVPTCFSQTAATAAEIAAVACGTGAFVANICRLPVPLTNTGGLCLVVVERNVPGPLNTGLGTCVTVSNSAATALACPATVGTAVVTQTVNAAGDIECRVASAAGAGTVGCTTGSLNAPVAPATVSTTCTVTTNFNVVPTANSYFCAAGTASASGTLATLSVICNLGAPTTVVVTGPSCSQGVLVVASSTCTVPATAPAVAAPVPAFTG
jgi:hypothetical protein